MDIYLLAKNVALCSSWALPRLEQVSRDFVQNWVGQHPPQTKASWTGPPGSGIFLGAMQASQFPTATLSQSHSMSRMDLKTWAAKFLLWEEPAGSPLVNCPRVKIISPIDRQGHELRKIKQLASAKKGPRQDLNLGPPDSIFRTLLYTWPCPLGASSLMGPTLATIGAFRVSMK